MSTKKQKREKAHAKRQAYLAKVAQSGLEAQITHRQLEQKRTQAIRDAYEAQYSGLMGDLDMLRDGPGSE